MDPQRPHSPPSLQDSAGILARVIRVRVARGAFAAATEANATLLAFFGTQLLLRRQTIVRNLASPHDRVASELRVAAPSIGEEAILAKLSALGVLSLSSRHQS